MEEIHLVAVFNLENIWPTECSPDSFPKLKSMDVETCNKLVTAFPSHMAGRFCTLEILKVFNCNSMVHIFDLSGVEKTSIGDELETQLKVLQITYVSSLKHIWNGDPQGMLSFKRLNSVMVTRCSTLEYIFPVSVAKGLQELNSLSISDDRQVEKIVHGDEVFNDVNFEFPQVSFVEMKKLPNLKYFYKGRHNIKWHKLKKLSMYGCHGELEAFNTETVNSKGGQISLLEEVYINKNLVLSLMKHKYKRLIISFLCCLIFFLIKMLFD